MQPTQVSAIALGNWNPKIFTPIWLKERLLNLQNDEEIEVLLDFNDMDFALKYKNLVVSPKRTVLELQTKSFAEPDINLFTKALIRIFDLLPQTPIKAIGINIIYTFSEEQSQQYLKILNKIHHFDGFEVTMVRHTLKKDNHVTNIVIEKTTENMTTVVFNFHYAKAIDFEKSFLEKHIAETQNILENGI